ncbi:SpoIIE family protein phosphatase [Iocasia frigidifontis]|uniref:SpoIIE family protein phosphatase n=1 Tax=Iocasia fonsfrigidae TaxID=2682810 RepID=A0A8A7KMR6_9FIRM|nr:SpoIIE family protein phosphatase [Iocasia fonsfrigidae]QTL99364.1 SpoIIE family protein phosphatase [Iocasia fonsfrigidae]
MSQGTYFAINQQDTVDRDKKDFRLRYDYFLLCLMGFLLAKAELLTGLYTLALIYWVAVIGLNRYLSFFTTLSIGTGLYLSGDYYNFSYLAAAFMALLLYKFINKKIKLFDLPLCVTLSYLLISLPIYYFTRVLYYQYFILVGESVFIYILSSIVLQGKEKLCKNGKLTRPGLITVFITSCGILIGLANLQLVPVIAVNIVIITFLIAMASTLGLNMSISASVLIGLFMTGVGVVPILTMVRYIVTAFISSLFYKKKKRWMLFGSAMAFFLYSGFSPTTYNLKQAVLELSVAYLIFLILPLNLWRNIFSPFITKGFQVENISFDFEEANNFKHHLEELAGLFQELSVTFKEVLPAERDKKVDDFIYIFRNKVCGSCQRRRYCWDEEKGDTIKKLALMLRDCVRNGGLNRVIITRHLGNRCTYSDKILGSAKASYEIYQVNDFWRERLNDKQEIVSEQLAGISEIIKEFASEPNITVKVPSKLEHIKKKALESNIEISNIEFVSNLKSERINFLVEMEPCAGNCPCEEQVLDLINGEYDYSFRKLTSVCGNKLKDKRCRVKYGPSGNYRLNLSHMQQASTGDVSGDSFMYKPLRDGRNLIVISDGMGIGKKAAVESEAAINLLESIIEAGFEQELAVKTINSALYLRNQDESFTTLDIAIFDTFTAEITFSKIGAIASYIKRGWDLIKVDSACLPAGILDKIELTSQDYQLKQGDFVIMLTDGIIDACSDIENKDEWLRQLLQNSSFDDPGDMVDYIMEVVLNKNGVNDDMTIVVYKIEEVTKKSRKFRAFSRIK